MSGNAVSRCDVAPQTAHSDAGVAGAGVRSNRLFTYTLDVFRSKWDVFPLYIWQRQCLGSQYELHRRLANKGDVLHFERTKKNTE